MHVSDEEKIIAIIEKNEVDLDEYFPIDETTLKSIRNSIALALDRDAERAFMSCLEEEDSLGDRYLKTSGKKELVELLATLL